MEKIDKLDKQILEIISQNARIPFKDVAADVVTLYVSAATNFVNYKDISGNGYKKALACLNSACKKDYPRTRTYAHHAG